MSYQDQLNNTANDNEPTRHEQISQDIQDIFRDDTLFGEMMAESVGKVLGEASAHIIENISEAINNTLQSDDFSNRLGDQLGWKDVEREQMDASMEREG